MKIIRVFKRRFFELIGILGSALFFIFIGNGQCLAAPEKEGYAPTNPGIPVVKGLDVKTKHKLAEHQTQTRTWNKKGVDQSSPVIRQTEIAPLIKTLKSIQAGKPAIGTKHDGPQLRSRSMAHDALSMVAIAQKDQALTYIRDIPGIAKTDVEWMEQAFQGMNKCMAGRYEHQGGLAAYEQTLDTFNELAPDFKKIWLREEYVNPITNHRGRL